MILVAAAVPEDSASAPFLSSLFPVPCLCQWPEADAEGREKMQANTGVTPQIPPPPPAVCSSAAATVLSLGALLQN